MYLVGLGMQALEWRITAPNNKVQCISGSRNPFPGNDLFTCYMGSKYLDMEGMEQFLPPLPGVRMTWTGNKVDLVELIYAWETAGCFNHGHATIKDIVDYIQVVFNIDLGSYYHTFLEMRDRVKRTAFLDKLIKFLNDRMDEIDRKK